MPLPALTKLSPALIVPLPCLVTITTLPANRFPNKVAPYLPNRFPNKVGPYLPNNILKNPTVCSFT